jgi:hypothetical protein
METRPVLGAAPGFHGGDSIGDDYQGPEGSQGSTDQGYEPGGTSSPRPSGMNGPDGNGEDASAETGDAAKSPRLGPRDPGAAQAAR